MKRLTLIAITAAIASCSSPSLSDQAAPSITRGISPVAALPHDAKAIADLVAAKIGKSVISVTANTDATKPAVADSEAVISDRRVEVQGEPPGTDNGAKIEVYTSAGDATARIDYLEQIAKASPIFADSYNIAEGDVVFRVSGHMPIDGVKQYKDVWVALAG